MVHLGLKRNYELNENFQKFVRMVFSLAFLPIHDVECMKKEEELTDHSIGLIAAGRTLANRRAYVDQKERRIAVMKNNWDAPNHGGVYEDVLAFLEEMSNLQLVGV